MMLGIRGAGVGVWPVSRSLHRLQPRRVAGAPVPVFTRRLLLIPLGWSLVGATAVMMLGMTEDSGLIVAGVFGTALIVLRNRRMLRVDNRAAVQSGEGDYGAVSVV